MGFGIRHFQAFLIFVGLSVAYSLRVNLSVAIVAMTDKESANPDFEVSIQYNCENVRVAMTAVPLIYIFLMQMKASVVLMTS